VTPENGEQLVYVDVLLAEWEIEKRSPRVQACVRRALGELSPEALLVLRKNPKLQIAVRPEAGFSVWAYFPAHRKRLIVRQLNIVLKPGASVLLVIGEKQVEQESARLTNANLRDHLGHVLLYLRNPKESNECEDAIKEWKRACVKPLKSSRK